MTTTLVYPSPPTYWLFQNTRPKQSVYCWLFHTGTGGAFTNENLEKLCDWTASSVIDCTKVSRVASVDSRSVKDHLLNARDTFGLNMTELAQILGVTRAAVYGWLDGVEPKPETKRLILSMSRAADQLARLSVERPELYTRRPMFDGKSLVDLLKANQPIDEAIMAIKSLAEKEATVRKEASTYYAGRQKRHTETVDEFATPLLLDDL